MDGGSSVIGWLQHRQGALWVAVVAAFGIGDMVTTSIGLQLSGVIEAGPVAATVIGRYGLVGMVGVKLATIGGSYLVWSGLPRPQRLGIPIGLASVGILVTVWNVAVIVAALSG